MFAEGTLTLPEATKCYGVNKNFIALYFPCIANSHWILFYADIRKTFSCRKCDSNLLSMLSSYENMKRMSEGIVAVRAGTAPARFWLGVSMEYRSPQQKCNTSASLKHTKVGMTSDGVLMAVYWAEWQKGTRLRYCELFYSADQTLQYLEYCATRHIVTAASCYGARHSQDKDSFCQEHSHC
jgi:hypothetical protein